MIADPTAAARAARLRARQREAGLVVVRVLHVPKQHADAVKRAAEAERDRLTAALHKPPGLV